MNCPGFPGNCAKLCDGFATCPDKWDELLSTCRSTSDGEQSNADDEVICSEEAGLYQCKDGSLCLHNSQVCDGTKDCRDGSDEDSVSCKVNGCEGHYREHRCDNGSCIRLEMACSAQNRPLCEDGSDMYFSLCKGKCYNEFPYMVDPYRWPCSNGTKKCIPYLSRCDGYSDCDDGTDSGTSSDESNCPLVGRIGLHGTLLLCVIIVALLWIVFLVLELGTK